MSQRVNQNRQDLNIASIGKHHLSANDNNFKQNGNKNQPSNQGGNQNSKKNKKKSKQAQQNQQNLQQNKQIDLILEEQDNLLETPQNQNQFINGQKQQRNFNSQIDQQEPQNNIDAILCHQFSDINPMSPIIGNQNPSNNFDINMKNYEPDSLLSSQAGSFSSTSSNLNQKAQQQDERMDTVQKLNHQNGRNLNKPQFQIQKNVQNNQIKVPQNNINDNYSINVQNYNNYSNNQNINQNSFNNFQNIQNSNQNSQNTYQTNQNNYSQQIRNPKPIYYKQYMSQQDLINSYGSDQTQFNLQNQQSCIQYKHDKNKKNSCSAYLQNEYHSYQGTPSKQRVQHENNFHNNYQSQFHSQIINRNSNNTQQRQYLDVDHNEQQQKYIHNKYINQSQNQEVYDNQYQIQVKKTSQSFDYYQEVNNSDSHQYDTSKILKRKKTGKSKSIIQNMETSPQKQGSQNDWSITTPNDKKQSKDDNFIFLSPQCLENQNSQNSQNSTHSGITTTSMQNISPSPPLPTLQKEKSGSNDEKEKEKEKEKEEGKSLTIFRCPIALEKYNIKLWIVYIDNLIEVMFKLPIQLIKIVVQYILFNQKLSRKDSHMWIHFLLIIIPVLIFTDNLLIIEMKEYFDVSYWYHAFRGQSTLKLYGVLMTADVVDKMLCTFGEYLILDVLWQKLPTTSFINLIQYLIPAILYVFLHSLVLFLSIIGHNVILNSDISFLFVMIFVHNSMKLKSSIFKKFTTDGYTSQTHADLRARFSKCFYVFLIWASMRGFSQDIVRKLMYFLGSEVIVEWVKHIFLMLLNNLKLQIVENMSKSCKHFVTQVRIIPAFQTQEIVNNKATQTFMEREKYLNNTPFVSPSLKIGFRVNFLVFHHAVIIIKILYPLMVNHFSYHNFWVCILCLRFFQLTNDILIYKFSFNHVEINKLYALDKQSLFKTLFQKTDFLIIIHGLFSLYKIFSSDVVTQIAISYFDMKNKFK